MKYKLNIDGGARGNPGPAAGGITLREAQSDKPVTEAGFYLGSMTNNSAEYSALIKGIELAKELAPESLHIQSDSQLVVKQVLGEYRMKSPSLRPLLEKVKQLLKEIGDWKIEHVKRDKNKRADELANMAMDAKDDVILIKNGELMS